MDSQKNVINFDETFTVDFIADQPHIRIKIESKSAFFMEKMGKQYGYNILLHYVTCDVTSSDLIFVRVRPTDSTRPTFMYVCLSPERARLCVIQIFHATIHFTKNAGRC